MSTALPTWMVFEDVDMDAEEVAVPSYKFYGDSITLYFESGPHIYYKFNEQGDRENVDGVTTILNVISKPYLTAWGTKLCIETLKEKMFDSNGMPIPYSTEELFVWFEEAKNKHKEKLETAGDIGKIAHNSLEQNIKYAIANTDGVVKSLVDLPTHEQAYNCVQAAKGWMDAHNVRWLHTEKLVYSRLYNVAGTLDGDALVDSCTDPFCKGCQGRVFKDRRSIIDFKSSNYLSNPMAYQTAMYQFMQIEEFGEPIFDRWVLRLGKSQGDFEFWYLPDVYFEADLEAFLAALHLYRGLRDVEERRRIDKKAFTELTRSVKKEAKAEIKSQEKATKAAAKAELKAAKALKLEAQKAHYKRLRAAGTPVVEAKALAYPVEVVEVPSEIAQSAKIEKPVVEKPIKDLPQQTAPNEWSL